jgi:photosystem I subunit 3
VRRSHVLRAQERDAQQQQQNEFIAKGARTLAAIALAATISVADVPEAQAKKDISGLTPCAKSKPFAKREKQAVKALNKRLKKYEEGSAGALAINDSIAKTQKRFKMYANTGVLCGKDGYPHLIADPGFALQYGHTGEILVPTFGFVYIAGLIGYAGRTYLISLKGDKKPTQGEIIIDVPKALNIFLQSAAWPIRTYTELRNGSLLAKDEDVTVSPR